MNIPNLITVLRVLLIPIFILLFYLPYHWSYMAASSVFALAAATDWLDGYLARRLEQSTPFGAFLDPVADKLMVAVALVLLVQAHANLWLTLPAAVIIGLARMDGGAGCAGTGRRLEPGQVENRSADARAGDFAGQPARVHLLGGVGLCAVDGRSRPDPVVDGAIPARRMAASPYHYR
jgi:hypothetical protein